MPGPRFHASVFTEPKLTRRRFRVPAGHQISRSFLEPAVVKAPQHHCAFRYRKITVGTSGHFNYERLLSAASFLTGWCVQTTWQREAQHYIVASANYWRESVRTISKLMSFTLVLGCAGALAQDRPAPSPMKPPAAQGQTTPPAAQGQTTPRADNTGINVRDKSGETKTPQKQAKSSEADRKLLAAVRRAVVKDKTLSKTAHNVKIISKDGVVTLRGPVRSEDEKGKVEKLAQQVAGVASVENQLDVKTVKTK
jgi:hyperosmotically inducible protein